jgi:hypothetical protein
MSDYRSVVLRAIVLALGLLGFLGIMGSGPRLVNRSVMVRGPWAVC